MFCSDAALESTGHTHVGIRLEATPRSVVRCEVSSNSAEVVIDGTPRTEFSPGDPIGKTVLIRIDGLKDIKFEQKTDFLIFVRCSSEDTQFDSVSMQASASISNVQFPTVENLSPVTVWQGDMVTASCQYFAEDKELTISVGGVQVNEEPVMRTVLLNATSSTLCEVSIADDELIAWAEHLSAQYWNGTEQRVIPEALDSNVPRRAKAKSGDVVTEGAEVDKVRQEAEIVEANDASGKGWYVPNLTALHLTRTIR